LKNFYFLIFLNFLCMILLNSNILFAQLDDDEFNIEKEEIVCAPDSVL